MAEDLRQSHSDGRPVKGWSKIHDVTGAEPGQYARYAGFTVVPRSMKEGRMEDGRLCGPVRVRQVDKDYNIIKEETMVPKFPHQTAEQSDFPGLGRPAPVTAEAIRSVLADDAEIERGLAPDRSADALRTENTLLVRQMMDMMAMMQRTMMGQQQQTALRPPAPAEPAPPDEPQGPAKLTFAGDFGTIRAQYDTVVVRDDCVVLGSPAGSENAYEPPVDPEKTIAVTLPGGRTVRAVNPGLSFTYKGDNLTLLLVEGR